MLSAANGLFLSTVIWDPSSQEVYLTFIVKKLFKILKEHLSRFKNVKSVKISAPHPVPLLSFLLLFHDLEFFYVKKCITKCKGSHHTCFVLYFYYIHIPDMYQEIFHSESIGNRSLIKDFF